MDTTTRTQPNRVCGPVQEESAFSLAPAVVLKAVAFNGTRCKNKWPRRVHRLVKASAPVRVPKAPTRGAATESPGGHGCQHLGGPRPGNPQPRNVAASPCGRSRKILCHGSLHESRVPLPKR